MRVAIVAQRYGEEVVGGAESHARTLAGRLRGDLGWQVEVFTTTALDYRSWANHYPPGRTLVDGIPVWRFDSSARRRRLLFGACRRLAEPAARRRPAPLLESLWLRLQGPYSPRLLDAIRRHAARFDRVLFFSYLYHPTVRGVEQVGGKAVLIPTAHDEAPLHFATTRRLFERCPLILANTEPERDLIRRVAPGARVEVAGLGFDEDAADLDQRVDADDSAPYLLYLGRVSRGKGVAALIEWFLRARARLGRDLVLRLAGQLEGDIALPGTPAVEYLGRVCEERKRQLVRGALAVVNPSPHESMSMLVLEGIAAGVPVLVNRACPVLDHYTRQVETCVGYDGAAEFAGALARLVTRDWRAPEARERLDRGRRWVREQFSWQRVLEVFARSLGDGA
jgi:glycosyltransferase involved in cell wall biosynthesis